MEARESFKKRSTVSAVTEMTLINNRLRGMMRTGWKKRPFELAITMSLVTFKGQVLMKQSGRRLSASVIEETCGGGNGCIASSGSVTFVPYGCWYEKAPLPWRTMPRQQALPSRAAQTQFPCIRLLIKLFPVKSTRFFERPLRLLIQVNPFTHYFFLYEWRERWD